MFFRSERLFLRPAWPEDWSDLVRGVADGRLEPGLPDDGAGLVPRLDDGRHPRLFITLPSMARGSGGSEVIGCIGLGGRSNGHPGEAELGFWINPERRGQGYATEAGRAMLAIARTLGHRRVVASANAGNRPANRVLAKLGFRPTGTSLPRHCPEQGGVVRAPVHAISLTGATCGEGGAMPFAA